MKPMTPKILPWLAHKAGIAEHRAEILWRIACHHAAHATGETDTPAYWAAAMDRLLELIAAERLREDVTSFGWRRWARLYRDLWQVPITCLDALMLGSQRGWRNLRQLSFD